jgi:hypothetical protein
MTTRRTDGGGAEFGGAAERAVTLRMVTAIMGAVVSLTFLFGFGNVWSLALRLDVPRWVAPLVAPAVDLSVLGLLLGTRYLALHGATREQLRPARRLLIVSSAMTLALNVADPLIAGQVGKAAFDAVGPLLLIGWAEVGPGLLQAISRIQTSVSGVSAVTPAARGNSGAGELSPMHAELIEPTLEPSHSAEFGQGCHDDALLDRARQEDAQHREMYQRPISAETLRKRLRVGAARSRMLVAAVRGEHSAPANAEPNGVEGQDTAEAA